MSWIKRNVHFDFPPWASAIEIDVHQRNYGCWKRVVANLTFDIVTCKSLTRYCSSVKIAWNLKLTTSKVIWVRTRGHSLKIFKNRKKHRYFVNILTSGPFELKLSIPSVKRTRVANSFVRRARDHNFNFRTRHDKLYRTRFQTQNV